MKKKIIAFLLATIILALPLASCRKNDDVAGTTAQSKSEGTTSIGATSGSTQSPDVDRFASGITVPEDNTDPSKKMIKASVGASDVMIYRDTIYYNVLEGSSAKIKYQNLNNIRNKGAELGADPLASSTSGGLFNDVEPWPFFLVDEEATSKNGGMPVFIIACDYSKTETMDVYRIFSYNSKDNSVKVIYEEPENIQWLALYGDYIFYETAEGDKGDILHRVKKDGSEHIEMENKDALGNKIHYIYEDKIYYVHGAKGLYSMNLDFSGSEYLFDVSNGRYSFAYDGYIYYIWKHTAQRGVDLCRRSISDPSKEETVLSGIAYGFYENGVFYYYRYDSEDAVSYNCNTIYGYIPEAKESFEAVKKPSGKLLELSGWNYEYLVCACYGGKDDYYSVVNIKTGKEVIMPQK